VPLLVDNMESFAHTKIVFRDKKGQYWLNTSAKNQLLRITFPEKFWTAFPADTTLLHDITVVLILKHGNYLAASGDSSLIVDALGQPQLLHINSLQTSALGSNSPYLQFFDYQRLTPDLGLTGTTQSLAGLIYKLVIFRNGQWQEVPTDLEFTRFYYYDETSNSIWLQNYQDNEVYIFDLKLLETTAFLTKNDAACIIGNIEAGINSWYKDRSDIFWMGTGGLGLCKIIPRRLSIQTYMPDVSIYTSIFPQLLERYCIIERVHQSFIIQAVRITCERSINLSNQRM